MQIAQQSERHTNAILTSGQALMVFLVLAILTTDAVAILGVLGMMTAWEAAAALFAVLTLSAGAIWTLLLIPGRRSSRPEEGVAPEGSPRRTPLNQ